MIQINTHQIKLFYLLFILCLLQRKIRAGILTILKMLRRIFKSVVWTSHPLHLGEDNRSWNPYLSFYGDDLKQNWLTFDWNRVFSYSLPIDVTDINLSVVITHKLNIFFSNLRNYTDNISFYHKPLRTYLAISQWGIYAYIHHCYKHTWRISYP